MVRAESRTQRDVVESNAKARQDRANKRIISGYFTLFTWQRFRTLAISENKTNQQLLEEAVERILAERSPRSE